MTDTASSPVGANTRYAFPSCSGLVSTDSGVGMAGASGREYFALFIDQWENILFYKFFRRIGQVDRPPEIALERAIKLPQIVSLE